MTLSMYVFVCVRLINSKHLKWIRKNEATIILYYC